MWGQLGDGTSSLERHTPSPVSDLADAVEISAGLVHTCARRSSGAVACWGYNEFGRLGDGTTINRLRPTVVVGLVDAVEISAGLRHTCARRSSGSVVCWGKNDYGTLGDGSTVADRHASTPTTVFGLTDAVELSTGNYDTCARRRSGGVVCWGYNIDGRLGDGTATDRATPTPVIGLADAVEISAGRSHTCARRTSGTVVCWGKNDHGALGDGTTIERRAPTPVSGLIDALEIATGDTHTCARRIFGTVVCWGNNDFGQLGDGTGMARPPTPMAVSGLVDAVELTADVRQTCARRASGAVVCWGENFAGQLGDGTTTTRLTPTPVVGL
jgi:alpha-tubulin suppressor-like RCC1 family protein